LEGVWRHACNVLDKEQLNAIGAVATAVGVVRHVAAQEEIDCGSLNNGFVVGLRA